ncbi:hypothetical protein [Paraburkholderia sediminicola]|uniref:hypothetical protein n=1 Tax=Paraburkholderia sediminicola TaxID=458836 RepID=UPI0038BAF915
MPITINASTKIGMPNFTKLITTVENMRSKKSSGELLAAASSATKPHTSAIHIHARGFFFTFIASPVLFDVLESFGQHAHQGGREPVGIRVRDAV